MPFTHTFQLPIEHTDSKQVLVETPVTLHIESDWGMFELMSATASLKRIPWKPLPPKTTLTDTIVKWDNGTHNVGRVTIYFYVVNDGSPISFCTSRGMDPPHIAYVFIGDFQYNNIYGPNVPMCWSRVPLKSSPMGEERTANERR
ncbi:uncharacterized protein EDB91DRAFT_1165061 [Suillus paluster]|uniref:uncharacterized protein n=1 Tax=Suillus paluster TaxID=48578 RepID=UPI001B886A78|nr:uncharacterized protein EDB91DRAFT_1165061 [Suillus paluster]KAG1726949.1 hypothetical protein EDB91DRAFT_1165061 [Suillus paluster]